MFEATGMWLRRGEEATVEAAGGGGGGWGGSCRKAHVWPNHREVLGVWFSNISGLARTRQPENSTLTQESKNI